MIFINGNTYKSEENRGNYDNLLLREVITGTFQIQNVVLILRMVRKKKDWEERKEEDISKKEIMYWVRTKVCSVF